MNNTSELGDLSRQTPGQMIKAAREAKRISIDEVVQKLLLSKQVVAALEEDNYSKISAKVYAEGYLKAYAKFLQIPTDTIIENFRSLNIYPDVGVADRATVGYQVENKLKSNIVRILENQRTRLILLVLAGVLILSMMLFFIIRVIIGKSAEITTIPTALTTTVSADTGIAEKTSTDILIPPEESQAKKKKE